MKEKKHGTEPRSKGFGWKFNIYTETMVGTIPAIRKTGTQNRYCTINERRRHYRKVR